MLIRQRGKVRSPDTKRLSQLLLGASVHGATSGQDSWRGIQRRPRPKSPDAKEPAFFPLPVPQLSPVFFGAAGMGKPR